MATFVYSLLIFFAHIVQSNSFEHMFLRIVGSNINSNKLTAMEFSCCHVQLLQSDLLIPQMEVT